MRCQYVPLSNLGAGLLRKLVRTIMGKISVLTILFSIFLIYGVSAQKSEKRERSLVKSDIDIYGTLIDEAGKPVEDAFVRLYYKTTPCETCVDQIFPGARTPKNGFFSHRVPSNKKQVFVFIDEAEPEGFFSPLFYLTEEERQNIPALSGISIKLRKKHIDLGEIKLPYRFGKVIIDLPSIFGKDSTSTFAERINVIVSDEKGRRIDEGILSVAAYDKETLTELKLAFPVHEEKTTWGLRLEYIDLKNQKHVFDYKLILRKLECKKIQSENGVIKEAVCDR